MFFGFVVLSLILPIQRNRWTISKSFSFYQKLSKISSRTSHTNHLSMYTTAGYVIKVLSSFSLLFHSPFSPFHSAFLLLATFYFNRLHSSTARRTLYQFQLLQKRIPQNPLVFCWFFSPRWRNSKKCRNTVNLKSHVFQRMWVPPVIDSD